MTFSDIRRAFAAMLTCAVALGCLPAPAEESTGPICLSEVMTANQSAYRSTYGYGDWAELTNTGSSAVNLKGYTLSRADDSTKVFQFPNMTLAPGEYAIVWFDGIDRAANPDDLHADFRLSSSGGTLLLASPNGKVLESLDIPALEDNTVYALGEDGEWSVSFAYTPGMANTEENHALLTGTDNSVESPIRINEIMSANKTYLNGKDWIELYNTSSQSVDISGWYLTDDENKPTRSRVPDGTVLAGGEAVALEYGDGLNFRLSKDGDTVYLFDSSINLIDSVEVPLLETDTSYSCRGDTYTTGFAPTPGLPNTQASADTIRLQLEDGVVISEIAACSQGQDYDWIELYNPTSSAVDLSGWGLSDRAGHPRKWTFPQGASIGAGEYLAVYASGTGESTGNGFMCTNFSLNSDGGYCVTLSRPDGTLTDRVFVPEQVESATYSRYETTFIYTTQATPFASNATTGYTGRAQMPSMTPGGSFTEPVTVTISVPEGQSVYYTTDCSDPTQYSTPYTGPFTVSENTVVRARAYGDGMMESYSQTQSYLFDTDTDVRVVSLVTDPDDMTGSNGIYTNYTSTAEVAAHVEVYDDGGHTALLSENCGVRLSGADSRKLDQKNFKVVARSSYGAAMFEAPLFPERGWTEYKGFVLRSSSEDQSKTRMRDSVLTTLAEGTGLYYQTTVLCIVYVNGEYWGQYNMRERICANTYCQFEGWTGMEDDLDMVTGNDGTRRGSNSTMKELLEWMKSNEMNNDEALEHVAQVVDIDNYIAYIAIEMYVGNADTMNVRRYRCARTDGKWRWVLYDLDWGFCVDTNSMRRWLDPEGMGASKATDNTLFVQLMKNDTFRDRFLTFLGEKMADEWSSEKVLAKIEARDAELRPLLERQYERWGGSVSNYESELEELETYARERPGKLMGYIQTSLSLTDEQMQRYFGACPDEIVPYED